jgi:hypothetical protein
MAGTTSASMARTRELISSRIGRICVISALHRQHRAVEFGKFLVAIDKAVAAELDVHYSRAASSRKRSAKPAGSDRNGEWSLSK